MPLKFNLHQLERDTLPLQGELPAADLDLDTKDEVIRVTQPLRYELELQQMEDAVLVTGTGYEVLTLSAGAPPPAPGA